MTLDDGRQVRKDAIREDTGEAVIMKPNTPSGLAAAAKREQLMRDRSPYTPTVQTYDPGDPRYQPGSPTYIGPQKKKK